MTTLENNPDLHSPITTPVSDNTVPNITPEYAKLHAHCRERYIELEELLEFAVDRGKLEPISLATEVKNLKQVICYTSESAMTSERLCQTEASLEVLYTKIAHLVDPVTIETLRATSDKYTIHRHWTSAWLLGSFCVGRNFLRQLFWVGLLLLLTLFVGKYVKLHVSENTPAITFCAPFLYGAIGAWIYLYRTLTDFYSERSLDPQEWPTYWLRLFMGALAGGLLVHFVLPEMQDLGVGTSTAAQGHVIAQTGVGLLAGYSVDFFYGTLDRLIQAILPPKVEDDKTPQPTAKQMQMEALLKRLQETDNEQDKATIRTMLEKL